MQVFSDDEKAAAQARIVELMCDGKTLSAICRDEPGMPHRQRVYEWIDADADFAKAMERAREQGADAIAEEILEIADDGSNDWMKRHGKDGDESWVVNGEHVQRSRLRVESRLKLRAKWHPGRYGDKITAEHTGKDGAPIQFERIERVIVDAKKPE